MEDLSADPLLQLAPEIDGFRVLAPCIVYGTIGAGGMGNVYRGHHLNLDIDVAVKCLKPSLMEDDPSFVERFRREGRSAAKINHPNVIRVYDVVESQGLHYLIMEMVQGETARQRVERKGRLKVEEALQIVYETAMGLGEAHRLGIVHRDIKPDNLLISDQGQVKVADLGLAKPTLGPGVSMLSSPNLVIGTPAYMPPEQWDGGTITGAADVWALGTTLFYLLAGREAYDGDNSARVMSQIVLGTFPDIRDLRDDIDDDLAEMMATATDKDPAKRYVDGRAMADAIEDLSVVRTSLRDREAGTSELRTMVSPPPSKRFDEVKRILREGTTTIPSQRTSAAPAGGNPNAAAFDAPTMASPRRGGTAPPTAMDEAPRAAGAPWGKVAAVVLVLGAAAGGYAWFTQPPGSTDDPNKDVAKIKTDNNDPVVDPKPPGPDPTPPPVEPFAEVERLAKDGDFEGAVPKAKSVYAGDASLTDQDERLPRLLNGLARQRLTESDLSGAFDALAEAKEYGDTDALRETREAVAEKATQALTAVMQQLAPTANDALEIGPSIDLQGRLNVVGTAAEGVLDELRIDGQPVRLEDGGLFKLKLALKDVEPGPRLVDVKATLRSGDVVELPQWNLTFRLATPTVPVAFVGALGTEPELFQRGGTAATNTERVAVTGQVSEPGARIQCFVNDQLATVQPVPGTANEKGEFRAEVLLTAGGPNTVRVEADKDGFVVGKSDPLQVVCLTEKPTVQVIAPKAPKVTTNDSLFGIELTTDLYANTAIAKVSRRVLSGIVAPAEVDVVLTSRPDGNGEKRWRGQVSLNPGINVIALEVTDIAGNQTIKSFEVDRVSGVRGVELVLKDGERTERTALESGKGGIVYTNAPDAILEFQSFPAASLVVLVDGKARNGLTEVNDDITALSLAGVLKEGQAVELTLSMAGGADDPQAWRRTLQLDTTPPTVTDIVTFPDPVVRGQRFRLKGRWQDNSRVADVVVSTTGRPDEQASYSVDNGTWQSPLIDGTDRDITLTVVATDVAGNKSKPLDYNVRATSAAPDPEPTKPDPVATGGRDKTFPGFQNKGETNALGYPQELVHTKSGIELVAVGFSARAKPQFYVAKDLVTERQWSGQGSAVDPQCSISGFTINREIRTKLPSLDLLSPTDWDAVRAAVRAGERRILQTDGGYQEWLVPANPNDSNWPIRKGSRDTAKSKTTSKFLGFRVLFRP